MKRVILLALACILILPYGYGQQLAFPGAEGYGKYTTGGRGGKVIKVTTLDDLVGRIGTPAEGSLREALMTPGDDPITIVFDVSGIIELGADIKVKRSNVTIAGQTAPGDGICLKGNTVNLGGSNNVIIRYIRFRPGDIGHAEVSALRFENSQDIIIDHCSMSWSIEETMGFYDNKNTTVQWCILSEGLYESIHKKGARGYAAQWGGQYASYHHNFIAHNNSRSPRVNGSRAHDTVAVQDYRNNVIFNWGRSGAVYGGEQGIEGGRCEVTWVNNYYIPGPATNDRYFAQPSSGNEGYAKWYISGNYMEGVTSGINESNWKGIRLDDVGNDSMNIKSDTIFDYPNAEITTRTALEVRDTVLAGAGAVLPVRDAVDIRLVKEAEGESDIVGNGIIDSQSEVGGWSSYSSLYARIDTDGDGMPDEYETANGLDPEDAADGAQIAADGYSNLEHYINGLTGVHGLENDPNPVDTTEALSTRDFVEAFSVYPNPSSDVFHIKGAEEIISVSVFDLSSRRIADFLWDTETQVLDLTDLKNGIYILEAAFIDGTTRVKRIIKD